MAESALERIIRLKKEKEAQSLEASRAAGADSSPSLETQEKKEEAQNARDISVPSGDSSTSSSNVVDSRPVEQVKPLSAMERLRQLKMGSSGDSDEKAKETIRSGSVLPRVASLDSGSGAMGPTDSSVVPVIPETPKKEPKTHPIAMEMAELEAALDAEVPGFVTILSQIHKKLKADPECVTLLDDEEIGVIVAGLEKHTNVTIVSPNAVKAAKKAAKVPVSASDL